MYKNQIKMISLLMIGSLLNNCGNIREIEDEYIDTPPTHNPKYQPGSHKQTIVDAGIDKNAEIDKPISIDGNSNNPNASYEWSKGSKVISNNASFKYTPTKIGKEILTLTTTNENGDKASDNMLLNVHSKNLLADKNSNINTTDRFDIKGHHPYSTNESHTDDNSGSIEIYEHFYDYPIKTAYFKLKKGKHYTFGAYIKAIGDDRGQNIMLSISGAGKSMEMNYNISKAGDWEEVILPYRADVSGDYKISVFTHRYALSTDSKKNVSDDGSNIDRSAKIYIDDFFVYESDDIFSKEPYAPKLAYESSNIKIDALGNWSIKEDEKWKDFFPKFAYDDFLGVKSRVKIYTEYGFTGYNNLSSLQVIKDAVAGGMKYNGIQINDIDFNNPNDSIKKAILDVNSAVKSGELSPTAVIKYEFDNEAYLLSDYNYKKQVANWLDENDKDALTGKRSRPINMLNGVSEGVARNYKDSQDIVGTYVTQSGESNNEHINPVSTFGILQKMQNQVAPVSIMQLQCYYHDLFIPSIFKGIADGAKGLSFWRGGEGSPISSDHGCTEKFEDNVWAPAIKDVFSKIDTMLPIIKEPKNTDWIAKVSNPTLVSIGTRDHNGKHYIILSNFSEDDLITKVHIEGINAIKVKDFFTKQVLSTVTNGNFYIDLKHHNDGYLVLELE